MALASALKTCTKCKQEKELEQFHKSGHGSKDGRHPHCKTCRNRKQAKYRLEHPDRTRLTWEKWYATNRDQHLEKTRKYFKTDKGRAIKAAARAKRYDSTLVTDITPSWLAQLFSKTTHCPLCGIKLGGLSHLDPTYPNLDHITPLLIGGTHTMENVRYTCRKCNLSRPKNGRDL